MKYGCNDEFFYANTPESFYWAGFIAADGCVRIQNAKYKQLIIGIDKKDIEHLYKFKRAIQFNGPISLRKSGICTISISSDKIFNDLATFNVIPRKTEVYDISKRVIGAELVNHFIRGYFDGDGSFYYDKRNGTNRLCAKLIGTFDFIKNCVKLLVNTGLPPTKIYRHKNSNCYYFTYKSYESTSKFVKFLYNNSNKEILLDRKFEIVNGADTDKQSFVKVIGTNKDTGEIFYFDAIKFVSNMGFNPDCVGKCCRGKKKTHKGFIWKYTSKNFG